MIKGMLDLSIKNVMKVIDNEEKAEKFLDEEFDTISEKIDGIKINMYRKYAPWNAEDLFSNFVISYKKMILYPEDMSEYLFGILKLDIENESIGDAQFYYIFELLRKSEKYLSMLPQNTEFFFEYVVRKPTISREYKKLHKLILLGYANSSAIARFGYVTTFPNQMETINNKEYAALIGCDTPKVFFKNFKFHTNHLLPHGVSITNLSKITAIRKYLLDLPSAYGGKIEGVVLQKGNEYYKFVQDDQYDKIHRATIKDKYEMPKDEENLYFLKLKALANKTFEDFAIRTDIQNPEKCLAILSSLAYMRKQDLPFHSKKTNFQIREDFFHVLKYLYIHKHDDNTNTLFIGRMQPPTSIHINIIKNLLLKSKGVCVAIVKGKKSEQKNNPFSFETIKEIIEYVFPVGVEVIEVSTGNIITAINTSTLVISKVAAGSDRIETYRNQLLNNPEIQVIEFVREDDVSATKLRKALADKDIETFKKYTDEQTWIFYESLQSLYTENNICIS